MVHGAPERCSALCILGAVPSVPAGVLLGEKPGVLTVAFGAHGSVRGGNTHGRPGLRRQENTDPLGTGHPRCPRKPSAFQTGETCSLHDPHSPERGSQAWVPDTTSGEVCREASA